MERLARHLLSRLLPGELFAVIVEPNRTLIELQPLDDPAGAILVELVAGGRFVLSRDDDAGLFERVEVSTIGLGMP
jgi:hypothetical protein